MVYDGFNMVYDGFNMVYDGFKVWYGLWWFDMFYDGLI